MQELIFGPALFYDIPEYLEIVTNNSFWQVFSMGHFPIHPIFLGLLWIFTKVFPVNVIAMLFGTASIIIFYKISKFIFKKGPIFICVLIFALFPAVWLINTNLMIESVTLTFYLAAIYFFLSKRKKLFFVSLLLMIGTHLQSVVWIPTIFLFPYIFETKIKKKDIFGFIKFAILAVFTSLTFYATLYLLSGRIIEGQTEQLSVYLSSGLPRMVRNSWTVFIRNFGSLTPFVLFVLLLKNIKNKQEWIAWIVFLGLTALVGANWQGDFMGRRIIFTSVVLALGLYKFLGKKSIFFILYLVPIILANFFLYVKGSPFILPNLPKDEVLVETHYLKPFTKYEGTILWIGESNLVEIDNYLNSGKRVFITKQAVTAPYRLLVGNNYHITSLGKVGESESRFLFQKYQIETNGDLIELKQFKGKLTNDAGQAVIFYDQRFWGRLARRRIDYGDVGTWIWAIVTNHHDPVGWTYVDVRGEYVDLFSS